MSKHGYNAIADTMSTNEKRNNMFVICPYAEVTAKQKDAMTEAEVDYKHQSMYEIMYNCLIKLLGSSNQSGK